MPEPSKMVFLGALDVSQDEALAIALPAHGTIKDIKSAIERANAERAEAAKKKTEALAKMFLDKAAIETKGQP